MTYLLHQILGHSSTYSEVKESNLSPLPGTYDVKREMVHSRNYFSIINESMVEKEALFLSPTLAS